MSNEITKKIPDLKKEEFSFFQDLIKKKTGITLQDNKFQLVHSRLAKRLRQLKLKTWSEYVAKLKENDPIEFTHFQNALTTNKTEFFREKAHFEYLEKYLIKNRPKKALYFWIAACSYGHEAYTLAMTMEKLKDKIGYFEYYILASDIDTDVLEIAKKGVYEKSVVFRDVSDSDIKRFFLQGKGKNSGLLKITDELKSRIKFRQYNLCGYDKIPLKFDAVFVRNVLIYFDQKTINGVIDKLYNHLKATGLIFTGLCETLTDQKWQLENPEPSVYLKLPKRLKSNLKKNLTQTKSVSKNQPSGHLLNEKSPKLGKIFNSKNKIKVLVVDDSKVIQKLMSSVIQKDESLELFGVASNPLIAEKIMDESGEPDVITLDINMPEMNGIEYLEKYGKKRNIPIVMISGVSNEDGELSLKCLELGAVDFVEKPQMSKMNEFAPVLNEKLKAAVLSKVRKLSLASATKPAKLASNSLQTDSIIVIGSSTGGTVALTEILPLFPEDVPPILIVQHIPKRFSSLLAKRLNEICKFTVKEAEGGEKLQAGLVLIAPGDKHMSLVKDKDGGFSVKTELSERVNNHIPSVDVLFDSVAKYAKNKAVGVMLTGMGKDGAKGMLKMKEAGAHTIAQNEETCVVFGMPREAIEIGAVHEVVPLEDCAKAVGRKLSKHKKAS